MQQEESQAPRNPVKKFNTRFSDLARKKLHTQLKMSLILLFIYGSYVIFWAFFPSLMSIRLGQGNASIAVWASVFVVLTSVLLSGYYTFFVSKKMDVLNRDFLEGLKDE